MITVWGRRNSINVQKVMWAVGELGLDHVRHDVGGSFGQLDTPQFAALNPNRLVPVLEDGDVRIYESNAIVRYLAARYGAGDQWPEDPAARAPLDQWIDWLQWAVIPLMSKAFFALNRAPRAEQQPEVAAGAAAQLGERMKLLDRHLRDCAYIGGDRFTYGDIPPGAAAYRYFNMQIDRPGLPAVERWFERLSERPAYRRHVMIPFGTCLEEWNELERRPA